MAPAGVGFEITLQYGASRTGIQARFPVTCVAKVNLFLNYGNGPFPVTQQCPAIGMPQAIFGMHEDTKRRCLQTFRTHRPLLKRQPGPIGRIDGAKTECFSNSTDHLLRPAIQRVGKTSRLTGKPGRKASPERSAAITDEHKAPRRAPGRIFGRRIIRCEIDNPAQQQSVRGQRICQQAESLAGRFCHHLLRSGPAERQTS